MIEKTIKLFGIQKKVILCRTNDTSNQYVIMESIDKQTEKDIDNYNDDPESFNKVFPFEPESNRITGNSVYLYGEINFDNKDDIDVLNKLNLIDASGGGWLYSNFDYETAEVTSEKGKFKMYPTWNAVKWFKYNYALLGKPKRVIVYKVPHLNGRHK